jgi:hypothetical protein
MISGQLNLRLFPLVVILAASVISRHSGSFSRQAHAGHWGHDRGGPTSSVRYDPAYTEAGFGRFVPTPPEVARVMLEAALGH